MAPSPVSARAAGPEDAAAIIALLTECHHGMTADRDGETWRLVDLPASELGERVDERIGQDTVVVGDIKGVAAGVGVYRLDTLASGQKIALLEEIFTRPATRGVGVGTAVLDLVARRAAEAGAVGLQALVLPGNRDAKNFFEAHRLIARSITVYRPLSASADQ